VTVNETDTVNVISLDIASRSIRGFPTCAMARSDRPLITRCVLVRCISLLANPISGY
jgi:hypothetical protein